MRCLSAPLLLLLACTATSSPEPVARPEAAPTGPIVITERSQREAAVGAEVTIIGVQTRTKLPTVNGVDVDGDYALSDRTVIVRGVLHRRVVTEVDPSVATRGPGTYYLVIDPLTGELAKPVLHGE